MRCLVLTVAVFTAATTTASLAEQEFGSANRLPQAQHPQRWKDAGKPWQDAGQQFKSIWGDITGDARQIGPAVRQDLRTKPRWSWDAGAETAPLYESAPAQSYQTQPQYLPADSQTIYVPQDSYAYPVETVPYSDPVPYVEQAPIYETVPVYGN